MMRVAIIGAGSVGRAVGTGMVTAGHTVVFGVRNPGDQRYADLSSVGTIGAAVDGADVLVLAVPADAVPVTVPTLGPRAGQVVIDATNAVRSAVPDGFATMGDLVASLVPSGVQVAKAFNTVGAEHLSNGSTPQGKVFLPIAGDSDAAAAALALATSMGFDAVVLGGRDRFEMLEQHARLWIHLAFGCGWGRGFAFTAVRS